MAERSKVMFSTDVAKRVDFLGLSDDAKLLYFELVMASDWDGAIPSPRLTHVQTVQHPDRFDELVKAGFVFEQPGYALIADHWMHNKMDKTNWPKYSHPFYEDIEQHFDWDLESVDRSYHRKAESKTDISLTPVNNVNEGNGGGGVAPATAATPPEKEGNAMEGNESAQADRVTCPVCGTLGYLEKHAASPHGYRVACPKCKGYTDLKKEEIPSSIEKVTA